MKLKHLLTTLALTCFANGGGNLMAQNVGDTFIHNGVKYEVTGSNLVTNGSFDEGFSGWTRSSDYTTAISEGFEVKTSGGQDGEKYLYGSANTGATGASSLGTAWSLEKNKTYVFSYYIKAETDATGTGYIISSLTNAKGTESFKLGTPTAKKNEWTRFMVVFHNRDYDYCQVNFRWLNKQWGFDNFVLAEVKEVVNDEVEAPTITHRQDFGGTSVTSYYYKESATYNATKKDFTIEMQGTADTQIKLAGVGIVYTPSETGTIRMTRKDNIVYVYENGTFKGTIGQYTMMEETELLSDYNFAALGDKIENNKFKLSSSWTMANTSAYGGSGIRISDNTSGVNNGNVLIWRGTGNDNYFSQKVNAALQGNTEYKIRVYQFTGANAGALFHIGLGNAAGDYSYASVDERLGAPNNSNTVSGLHTMYITTPAEFGGDVYFTFKNSNPSTTDKTTQNDALTQIEWISLVKCDGSITGATDVKLLEGEAYAPADVNDAKVELLAAITDANSTDVVTNVGSRPFQKPESAVSDFNAAIEAAQSVYDNASATLSEIEQAIIDLESAVNAWKNVALNAPAAGKRIRISNMTSSDFDFTETPVTIIPNDAAQGGYDLSWGTAANDAFAQSFVFVTTENTNQYKLAFYDAENQMHYLCDGTKYGNTVAWAANQIRTTTNVEDAFAIEVVATEEADVWNLIKVDINTKIGSNGKSDKGFYTSGARFDLKLEEAEQASVELSIAAGKLATRIFPFTPVLPDGVEAYSCNAVDGTSLTLTKVDAPKANKPYILYSEKAVTSTNLTGWGIATADSYTEGLLTGVYTEATVPTGSYVLQTHDDVQGFYKVATEAATSSAYRVYVTVSTESGVKMFTVNFEGLADAIKAAREAGETTVRYNLAGQRVNDAQKGIVIVNGKKVLVK